MPMRRTAVPTLAAAALSLALAGCGSATTGEGTAPGATSATSGPSASATTGGTSQGSQASAAAGAYVTLQEYEADPSAHAGSAVVYFFHAGWCPSCRATESALGESGVPDGLTVVKVDFDAATELRQRYGVTQQHTFVQVDDNGSELARWTGSADGAAILAETV
jgi:thioredoxin 1